MQHTLSYPSSRIRPRSSWVDLGAILLFLCVATLVAAILGWQFWHANRIYTGAVVAGVPVGGLTRAVAVSQLRRELTPYPLPAITLVSGNHRWALSDEMLSARPDLMGAINQAYLVGRDGNPWTNLRAQWRLLQGRIDVRPSVALDPGQVRFLVSQAAAQVRRSGQPPAHIQGVTLPGEAGIDVDIEATTALVLARLQGQQPGQVDLQIIALPIPDDPGATHSDPLAALPFTAPLIVRRAGSTLQFALDPMTLEPIVRSRQPLQIDEEGLTRLVAQWSVVVDLPARDARLRFNPLTKEVSVLQPSQTGRRLDVAGTVTAIRQALEGGSPVADLVVEAIPPAVDMNRIPEMGIQEQVVAGVTYFRGSSAARVRNIEVAAEKFDGVVIPPNQVFSFNQIVEDVSAANGFEDSLIIWGDRTAVGVGGGVCQVSTTLFRAVFEAGLPIVERYNHGYVVSWYGEPGMDATIYTPTVDFRFRNNTGAYLLIHPEVDGANGVITFYFYGSKSQSTVVVNKAVVTDVTPPEPPIYQEDASLALGQIRQVEWAQDGMTVTVERVITGQDGTVRPENLVSHYQPWPAVYLIGPGTSVPEGATVKRLETD